MKPNRLLDVLLGAVVAFASALPAAEPHAATGGPPLTSEQWRVDLDVLVHYLPRKHLNAFFHTPEKQFRSAAAEFRAQIPALDQPAIVLGFARLAAMLRDGHTSVDQPPSSNTCSAATGCGSSIWRAKSSSTAAGTIRSCAPGDERDC